MKQLTEEQRYNISAYLQSGKSRTEIANLVGVHRSTISRELRRNSDKRNVHIYKPDLAQAKYMSRMLTKALREVYGRLENSSRYKERFQSRASDWVLCGQGLGNSFS